MPKRSSANSKTFGASFRPIDLSRHFNWPSGRMKGPWWEQLAQHVGKYAGGKQTSWGIPFHMGSGKLRRVIKVAAGDPQITLGVTGKADFLCILHDWQEMPETINWDAAREGLVVGEYELGYADGSRHTAVIRGRFEVGLAESPGPAWAAKRFDMGLVIDPLNPPPGLAGATALRAAIKPKGVPLVCALANPHPRKTIRSFTIRCFQKSPLLLAALTLYKGTSHPLRHLPRRLYRISGLAEAARIEESAIDMGFITRIEKTAGPRHQKWLDSAYLGLCRGKSRQLCEPTSGGEDMIEVTGADDATVWVKLQGRKRPLSFSLGQAFHKGKSPPSSGRPRLEIVDRRHQWMQVIVRDSYTGKPTPVRIHISGPRGNYIPPYGHVSDISLRGLEEYGLDVLVAGRNFAYVPGEFTTELPAGQLYLEINKGFEYRPIRKKVTIKPGQRVLELSIDRVFDWRAAGWVTADTHIHFISPHTAWLEARCEGINLVNLLATQWSRICTNLGDLLAGLPLNKDDTLVCLSTENRHHILGHITLMPNKGKPVFPMATGGPGESWFGDPDCLTLTEWARQNRRRGGLVIRPHFPGCGYTEDPVAIINGAIDAVELRDFRAGQFSLHEWYRYLNCGYRLPVVGGTDKMGPTVPLGYVRTYAKIGQNRPFSYDCWARTVRAGRTFATTGPLIDMTVDGKELGQTIRFSSSGGQVEVQARAESLWPLGALEVVCNGTVVAATQSKKGEKSLCLKATIPVKQSGWFAARCTGYHGHPARYMASHTSPIYLQCGRVRAFDPAAARHMLGLIEGGTEYLNRLAIVHDQASQKRMLKVFNQARQEIRRRLAIEAKQKVRGTQKPYRVDDPHS